MRLPSTVTTVHGLVSEQSIALSVQPVGVFVQTNQMSVESLLQTSVDALLNRSLISEGAVSASVTTAAPAGVSVREITKGGTTKTQGTTGIQFQTDAITPNAGELVLLSIGFTASTVQLTTVTGAGLTWERVISRDYAPGMRHEFWRSQSSSPGSGAVTITYPRATVSAAWSVMGVANVSTLGTNGSSAVVQSAGGIGGGTTSHFVSLLPAEATRNLMIGALLLATVAGGITTGPDMTEVSLVTSVETVPKMQTEWGASTSTRVSWSWSTASNPNGGLAVEVG